MNIWHDIDSKRITPENFVAVIEIGKGGKQKYELDKQTGLLILDRILYTSTHYPANYGFIPHTLASDGDPLDVLVLCSEELLPMSLVKVYPIGVITMEDNGFADEKIIAIPFTDPNYNSYSDISDLPAHVFDEMQHFFTVYKQLEGKKTAVNEVLDRNEAVRIISESLIRYKENLFDILNKEYR
ncbi:MAG TPA: inorganic pyrophosphatase [Clostridiales bacterium]|nr:inorganic pyrophosphatase [Clostridiales bacterium]